MFKPGATVNAIALAEAFISIAILKDPSQCIDSAARQIIEQYSLPGELAIEIAKNSIDEYSRMYPKNNNFIFGCGKLGKLLEKHTLPGLVDEHRPIRLALYISKKFKNKLMLGCYRYMRIVS